MTQTPYVSTGEIRSLFLKAISDVYRKQVPQYGTLLAPVSDIDATALKEEGAPINHLTPRTPDIDAAQLEMPKEALNKSLRMSGSRSGMGCKADFAGNSWLLARNSTQQTARARLIARRRGLVQRFPKRGMTSKNVIEGTPPRKRPILLHQTSFKALEELVALVGEGDIAAGTHTARFDEIEQREMALTRKGRALYDFQSNLGGEKQNSYAANEARSAFEVALGAAVLDQIQLVEDAETGTISGTLDQLARGVAA